MLDLGGVYGGVQGWGGIHAHGPRVGCLPREARWGVGWGGLAPQLLGAGLGDAACLHAPGRGLAPAALDAHPQVGAGQGAALQAARQAHILQQPSKACALVWGIPRAGPWDEAAKQASHGL